MSGIDRYFPDLLEDAALLRADDGHVEEVLRSHLSLRDTPAGDAVCALAVPASGAARLREVADPDHDLVISLYGDTGLEGLVAARDLLQDDAWITIRHLTLPTRSTAVLDVLNELPFTVPTYLELPVDEHLDDALGSIAADGVERAAFRSGPVDALAQAIAAAARHSVPFSITGDVVSGGIGTEDSPGGLALLAATALALDRGEESDVADLLRAGDRARLRLLTPDRAGPVRQLLRSLSCSSVLDVHADMAAFGGTT